VTEKKSEPIGWLRPTTFPRGQPEPLAVRSDVPIRDPISGHPIGSKNVFYPLKDVTLHPDGHEHAGTVARWPKGNPFKYEARIRSASTEGRQFIEQITKALFKTQKVWQRNAGRASGISRNKKAERAHQEALRIFNEQVSTGASRHVAVGRAAQASGLSKARVNQLVRQSKKNTNGPI
jgi:hypothetical protein